MELSERIKLLDQLGKFLIGYCNNHATNRKDIFFSKLHSALKKSQISNPYFEKANIIQSLSYWGETLNEKKLNLFVKGYKFVGFKNVGIIMAGNIPLVGFHDFLCVFLSGNKSVIKLSKKDEELFLWIISYLKSLNEEFHKYVEICNNRLEKYDCVIATGNQFSANQFKKYFDRVPHIIRSSRFSVAILDGNEKKEDLQKLSNDIFMYYGLGCRSVSKIYLPKDYDLDILFKQVYSWKDIINNSSYYNNYTYNKTIYLMSEEKFFDNGFLILKESTEIGSPIGAVFFEYYENDNTVIKSLKKYSEKIQCIVGKNIVENSVEFGNTQRPSLDDFADKINTLDFLLKLS